ncbi:alcohol dehydrogenase catalytic domain-containing protein [Robbsia sp. Bb-Pol-6]|uniref:Alcohol dehydrogenase catalytic domain-containing protein n=1 Tax=Robbsia betulipollinis TaxID=2981849 RepID=A0ABT3ZHZ9_9BURK|nr:alcohol dehydrogenase catalytic domain-containing protein [Robbsia betulipollinis]
MPRGPLGAGVKNFRKGDRVLISCITARGSCANCKRQLYSHCTDGGWILGHLIDGTEAEYVRIPHADNGLYPIPQGADEEALVMLSNILPTGFEIGVLTGQVKPGNTVAIVDAVATLMRMTDDAGVDVAIEAVGIPATFDVCQKVVAPGGHIANVGVHGKSVELHLETPWIQNVTLTTGLVNTNTTPLLLKTVHSGKLSPAQRITHRCAPDDILKAYAVFGNAAQEKALKAILAAA